MQSSVFIPAIVTLQYSLRKEENEVLGNSIQLKGVYNEKFDSANSENETDERFTDILILRHFTHSSFSRYRSCQQ